MKVNKQPLKQSIAFKYLNEKVKITYHGQEGRNELKKREGDLTKKKKKKRRKKKEEIKKKRKKKSIVTSTSPAT